MTLRESYRLSLKMPEAEELLDLAIYRPLAFLLVRIIHRLPVTPNQISILSMGAGLAAAGYLAAGSPAALQAAAIWYFAANVLDCSDGQLARIQNSGTPLGRIVDGTADYISSTAIFLGIGAGYAGMNPLLWLLVIAAGVASAVQSGMFDYVQSEFISASKGEGNYLARDLAKFTDELERMNAAGGKPVQRYMLRSYLNYLQSQSKMWPDNAVSRIDPAAYRAAHRRLIRMWSFLGPTTNRTLLMLCALFGRIDLFLWAVVVPANIWLLACWLLERHSSRANVKTASL
jgi:hypothetical protein